MKAADQELGLVLTRERRFLIPTYQRDYEWTEVGQWQLLGDDILDVAHRLAERRAVTPDPGKGPDTSDESIGPHFLGAVVLEALPQRGAQVNASAIIDGQQRLTTVFLLLRGLLDVLNERGLTTRARQVRKWILINPDDVEEDFEVYKLWPRRRDRDAWQKVMEDAVPSDFTHRYVDARRYFYDRFLAEVENLSVIDADDFFGTLVDALATKIKLVIVDLDNSDDAQLIFEVLNGRQTPLSASDLVKNLLFMRAGSSDQELDKLYDTYWAPFDDEWWSGTIGRGHAARGRRDQLLATWLTIHTSDEVNLGRLYGEARNYLNTVSDPLPVILGGIHELAREYKSIYDHEDNDPKPIADAYKRLEKLGITTAIPLLAWLRTLPLTRLSAQQHERAVVAVDSFVVRRVITGGQTRGYGRAFLEVLQAAQQAQGKTPVDEVIISALLDRPNGQSWPTDEEVIEDFCTRSFYGRMRQDNIRLILGPIDAYLQKHASKTESAFFNYDELTIEHILPREWRDTWKITGLAAELLPEAENQRDRSIHRMGNLTLITGNLNSSVSNGPWANKRPELAKHSNLTLNSIFKDDIAWNEIAIDERGKALALVACKVWSLPKPDQS